LSGQKFFFGGFSTELGCFDNSFQRVLKWHFFYFLVNPFKVRNLSTLQTPILLAVLVYFWFKGVRVQLFGLILGTVLSLKSFYSRANRMTAYRAYLDSSTQALETNFAQ
jgi:hypothetical protein